ncbi:hypothetical protein ACEPAI_8524 [Sanghuangporus weigelae]
MATRNVLALRSMKGIPCEVDRDVPIKRWTYRQRGSFGAAEDQLSPNSKRQLEMSKSSEGNDDDNKDKDLHSLAAASGAVESPQSISQANVPLDAAVGRLRRARAGEEPRVSTLPVNDRETSSLLAWRPAGYFPSAAHTIETVTTKESVSSVAEEVQKNEPTPQSEYRTVPSEITHKTLEDEEGFRTVTHRHGTRHNDERSSDGDKSSPEHPIFETPYQRLSRGTQNLNKELLGTFNNRFVVLSDRYDSFDRRVEELGKDISQFAKKYKDKTRTDSASKETVKLDEQEEEDNTSSGISYGSKLERKAQRKTRKFEERRRQKTDEVREWAQASAIAIYGQRANKSDEISPIVSSFDQEEFTSGIYVQPSDKGKYPDPRNYENTGLAFSIIDDIDKQMEYLLSVREERLLQEQRELERRHVPMQRVPTLYQDRPGPSGLNMSEKERKERVRTHQRYKSRSKSRSSGQRTVEFQKKEKNIKHSPIPDIFSGDEETHPPRRGPPDNSGPSSDGSDDER